MRFLLLILFLFISLPVSVPNTYAQQADIPDKGVLIRDIRMEGFVLQDKAQFVKMFKPYRNKFLKKADMDELLEEIQIIYEREGYQELVAITYQVDKHRLIYTALMTT